MRLRDYLRPELVATGFAAGGPEEAVEGIAAFLDRQGAVPSREDAERGLREREQAHTTAMGQGIAIPHATLHGLEDPVVALAISASPVPFGPPETEPVRIFFVLLTPPGRERDHIRLLARICRLARHPDVVEALQGAATATEALAVVEAADARP